MDLEGKYDVIHLIFGKEVSESGTPHLQGYVRFSKRKRVATVKKVIGDEAHVEVARNPVAAVQYCKKDGDFVEFGSWVSEQGKRSDLCEIIQLVQEGHTKPRWWILNNPEYFNKYEHFISKCVTHLPEPVAVPGHPLRAWQSQLWEWLRYQPDNRHIMFIVDFQGNYGKSWFSRYYQERFPETTQILGAGKFSDLTYAYKPTTRVCFMDVPRSRCDNFPYPFLEKLKDGSMLSSKYESTTKTFNPPHVVVFMNELPQFTKLSIDRYLIRILQPSDNRVAEPIELDKFIDHCHTGHQIRIRDDLYPRHDGQDLQDVYIAPEVPTVDDTVAVASTPVDVSLTDRELAARLAADVIAMSNGRTLGDSGVASMPIRASGDESSDDEEFVNVRCIGL